MHAETLPAAPDAPMDTLVEVLGLVVWPIPLPVERAMVLRVMHGVAKVQVELSRYLVDGPFAEEFAFGEEVCGVLSESLREVLEIEASRFDAAADADLITAAEREQLGQLLGAIERFQEEWGRG